MFLADNFMSRVGDILVRVRDVIGDPDGSRWTDTALLRRFNEGQYDIGKKAELFKKTAAIQLIKGQFLYVMPDDFIKLKEVMFAYKPLTIEPAQQMIRKYGSDWRLHTTENEVHTVVTDRQDAKTLRLYPRPFIDDLYDIYTFDSDTFGVTDELTDYTFDAAYGVVGSIYDTELMDENLGLFGILVNALEGNFLTVEYVRRPTTVLTVDDDLEIPDAFDTALVRYISGTALRDDIDAQNRAMGNEELILYQNELSDIESVSKQSNTSIAHNNQSEYRGMG